MKDLRHLRNYGYSFGSSVGRRHSALKRVVSARGYLWPLHRLVALRTLYRNAEPGLSKKASSDVKYVQKLYKSYKKHGHRPEHRRAAARRHSGGAARKRRRVKRRKVGRAEGGAARKRRRVKRRKVGRAEGGAARKRRRVKRRKVGRAEGGAVRKRRRVHRRK
jgi:hypothetical protein